MNSRDRIRAAWEGRPADHPPLTCWCFGLPAPEKYRWSAGGIERRYWYTLRLEHLHTLPQPWTLEDDFNRVRTWHALGIDDVVDVSVPWGMNPEVTWRDSEAPAGGLDPEYPVMVRDYQTPCGPLRHAVRKTGEAIEPGWVVQPHRVPLIEDFNIPRAVRHVVSGPADVARLRHLYCPPDARACAWFEARMATVRAFADAEGVPVQAWAGFGMDAAVWFTGTEGAVMMAMDHPEAFGRMFDIITEADLARVELAAATPGVDMVCERGWYSSTDFWSPALFDTYVFPHVRQLAAAAHRHGRKFGYVMTTGVARLGPRLAEAGVDVLYFVDPVQDRVSLKCACELTAMGLTVVGGTNALSLASGDENRIRREVHEAMDALGPTHRFILHPVDALFPDTPWAGIECLVEAWKEFR